MFFFPNLFVLPGANGCSVVRAKFTKTVRPRLLWAWPVSANKHQFPSNMQRWPRRKTRPSQTCTGVMQSPQRRQERIRTHQHPPSYLLRFKSTEKLKNATFLGRGGGIL
ncbi:unnamed protein product [Sphacelaria rigidula]